MKIATIIETLALEAANDFDPTMECQNGYCSDLLSDVMGFAKEGDALITIQAHKNTVAVATLVGMPAIIICNQRPVPQDMVDAANAEGVALLVSRQNQFQVAGRLYALLQEPLP
jgi:hypothetical protein